MDDVSSKKDLEENHTREIEIETAFKTFQEAITLQKRKQFVEAYAKYKELQKKDVIYNHYYEETEFVKGLQNGSLNTRPNELSYLSQNVKTIRYLYFRNRGFLYFHILQSGDSLIEEVLQKDQSLPDAQEITHKELTNELFYLMIDDFVNCFVYLEVDESLLRLLYDLFTFFDLKKLARYTLEYTLLLGQESEDVISVLPMNEWVKPVWEEFKKRGLSNESVTPELEQKLSFLAPIREDFRSLVLKRLKKQSLNVTIKPQSSWLDVIVAFNQAIKHAQDKDKQVDYLKFSLSKFVDPYVASESMMDSTSYSFPVPEKESTPLPEVPPEPKIEEVKEEDEAPKEEPMEVEEEVTPVPTAENAPEKVVQRSSRRLNKEENIVFELDDVQLTRHHYFETVAFFKHLNSLLQSAFHTDDDILHDVVCHIVDADLTSTSPTFVLDFVKTLNEWKPHIHTELLLSTKKSGVNNSEADADKLKLLDVLTHFGNLNSSNSDTIAELLDDVEDYDYIRDFLQKSENDVVPKHARTNILYHLLGGEKPSILAYSWSSSLYDNVKDWVIQLEPEIFRKLSSVNSTEDDLRVCLSIFEMFVDAYIFVKGHIDKVLASDTKGGLTKAAKLNLNGLSVDLVHLEERLRAQSEILQSSRLQGYQRETESEANAVLYCRYIWLMNYLLASQSFSWKEKKFVVIHLQHINPVLKKFPDLSISYPNYTSIGDLNSESYERRSTTSSILSIFSKILWSEKSATGGAEETIVLLENILIDKGDANNGTSGDSDGSLVNSVIHGRANLDRSSLSSVSEFLDVCPIDLKLSLWNILFLYYEDTKLFDSFQRGFEQNAKFMLSYFKGKYCEIKGDRSTILLNTLNYFGGYLRIFLKHLAVNDWRLPINDTQNSLETIKSLAQIFELFYCFSLHEEAALITGAKFSVELKSKKAFQRLKDFCIETVTIILVYGINQLKSENCDEQALVDLLLLVHNQLGIRRLCDSSNGVFLKLAEDTLVVLKDRPDRELSQLLSCRFHYKVKIKDTFPTDHGTTRYALLEKASATELAKFILPLCFRHNPLLKVPRNDMKQVADDIFEVLKELDLDSDKTLVQNNAKIEMFYQNTIIDSRFIKRAFYGLVDLNFENPVRDYTIANMGLYFVEAIFMFNSYKIRKKSAQSRTVELEKIVRLLKDDLICGSERVESWILLGQAYGYIVEDDLIWTSDKLNIIERKVITANLQRQSLLSYIMAINILTQKGLTDSEQYKPVISVLMNSFVKELYNANRAPLDMIAFKTQNNAKFVRKRHTTMMQPVADQATLTNSFCFKLMQQCLHLAIRSNDEEWSSFYYLAKLQSKLSKPPIMILDTMLESSRIAWTQGSAADPFLEPSYALCSWIYKFFKADKVTLVQALDYLKRDHFLKVKSTTVLEKPEDLYRLLIGCFKTINSLDKRGWYHKQCYRMAMIYYEEFDDFKEARKIMSRFFTLKATNKTYLQMWKPEHERPGKHFVYMYQYTEFYIKLLRRELDLASLVLMLPKLRRANSTMIKLYFAWENICSSICKLIRVIAKVEDGSTEKFLFMKPYQSFVTQAKLLNEAMKGKSIPDGLKLHICYLHVINDMRKLNNGFGPTSLIDDTLCSVYLMVFKDLTEKLALSEKEDKPKDSNATPKESTKVKRLARRDLFPYITGLVNTMKRDVESALKDQPDLFNEFIRNYISERKQKMKSHEVENSPTTLNKIGEDRSPALLPAPTIPDPKLQLDQDSTQASPITQNSQAAQDNQASQNSNNVEKGSVTSQAPPTISSVGDMSSSTITTISDLKGGYATPAPEGAEGSQASGEQSLFSRPSTITAPLPGRTGPRAGIIKKSSVDDEIERSFQAQTTQDDTSDNEGKKQQKVIEDQALEATEELPENGDRDSPAGGDNATPQNEETTEQVEKDSEGNGSDSKSANDNQQPSEGVEDLEDNAKRPAEDHADTTSKKQKTKK